MNTEPPPQRTLGFLGATGVGVGAIVGGGILALAGVAFQTTGPSATLAFALNGVVALLTAASFAELAVRFPRSGGTYTYARQVLTVEAAFGVGWVVWFASVVAAVLYALGFAVFLVPFLEQMVGLFGRPPAWLGGRFAMVGYAAAAVAAYSWTLSRPGGQGGQWATVGKVVVFGFLVLAGFFSLLTDAPAPADLAGRFRPFFSGRTHRPGPGDGLHLHRAPGLRPDRRGGRGGSRPGAQRPPSHVRLSRGRAGRLPAPALPDRRRRLSGRTGRGARGAGPGDPGRRRGQSIPRLPRLLAGPGRRPPLHAIGAAGEPAGRLPIRGNDGRGPDAAFPLPHTARGRRSTGGRDPPHRRDHRLPPRGGAGRRGRGCGLIADLPHELPR